MINNVVLVGRLTKDVELKQTQSGLAVARFTLAVNRPFGGQNGEKQADFINVVVWRKQAENCANYLKKGSLAGVTGRIQTGSYEGQDGKKVFTVEVVADSVQFLEPKSSTNNAQNGAYQQQNAPSNQQQGYNQQPSYQQYEQPSAPDNSRQTVDSDDLPF